jgi:hypothetical protein
MIEFLSAGLPGAQVQGRIDLTNDHEPVECGARDAVLRACWLPGCVSLRMAGWLAGWLAGWWLWLCLLAAGCWLAWLRACNVPPYFSQC